MNFPGFFCCCCCCFHFPAFLISRYRVSAARRRKKANRWANQSAPSSLFLFFSLFFYWKRWLLSGLGCGVDGEWPCDWLQSTTDSEREREREKEDPRERKKKARPFKSTAAWKGAMNVNVYEEISAHRPRPIKVPKMRSDNTRKNQQQQQQHSHQPPVCVCVLTRLNDARRRPHGAAFSFCF